MSVNRHNYTFLDVHRNLEYMNRLQEVRVTNNKIKFPKRKTNNDFIWDRQFEQHERAPTRDLKDYPSEDETIKAWKEGISQAQSPARDLGMAPTNNRGYRGGDKDHDPDDDNPGDDDKPEWFYKPMEYMDMQESLDQMISEEQQENLRRQLKEDNHSGELDDTNSGSGDLDVSCSAAAPAQLSVGDLRRIVNPVIDQKELATSTERSQKENSATILVPGIGKRYMTTVINELRDNPLISVDRLKRIKDASRISQQSAGQSPRNAASARDSDTLSLFDDCAFLTNPNTKILYLVGLSDLEKEGKEDL